MNRLEKIIAALVLWASLFLASANAQPAGGNASDGVAAVSAATVAPAPTEIGVPAAAPPLYTIPVLELPITNSMVCTWIVAALILVIVRATTSKRIQEVPSGMQNLLEALVEGWEKLMGDILDARVARWVFPFATTFFIFIIISNFVDVIPGVGSIGKYDNDQFTPFFRPPTSDANLTLAMAGIFLVMSLFWAVRYNGFWGLTKHIFGVKVQMNKWLLPLMVLMFLFIGVMDLVSILFARPVALAMRLYGNIYAGSTIMDMTFHMKSWFWSIVLAVVAYGYDAFVCMVQAFVFAILVVAFVGTLCSPHSEESPNH